MTARTYDFKDLVEQSGLSERNVRYYLYELIPEEERKKGSQRYSKSVRDKLVFVAKLREEMKKHRRRISLEGMRQILKDAAHSIEAVADGREPLEILDTLSSNQEEIKKKIKEAKTRGEDVMPVTMDYVESDSQADSAMDFIEKNKPVFSSGHSPRIASENDPWQRIRLGQDMEIRVRGNYPKKTLDQLRLLGRFIESILRESKKND